MHETNKGYKVFNPDWTCRGFQFEVGKVFEKKRKPKICKYGFHFCEKVSDCFSYYAFNPANKVAEIEALGDIDVSKDKTKYCTNKIRIIRKLTWQEVLDLANSGKNCTGYRNSGDHNSGNNNSGNNNSDNNNSGHYNSGGYNSGDYNSGHCNSGNYNSGNRNSGDYNSGDCNSGDHNRGDHNSGDWNSTDSSSGCFNTKTPKIFLFNKISSWTYSDWWFSEARNILSECPSPDITWVFTVDMTNKEKRQHPEYETTGGFLKRIKEEPSRQFWWNHLPKKSKKVILELPNFDKDIFKRITGIDVGAEE